MPGRVCVALLAILLGGGRAAAQCTPRADVLATAKIASAMARCIGRRGGSAESCAAPSAPACAGSFVQDMATLVTWPGPGPLAVADLATYRDQLACQRALGTATGKFLRARLRSVALGAGEAQAITTAGRRLGHLDRVCAVTAERTASGALVPILGGACAGVGAVPGVPVDVAAMRACLEEATEPWFERVLRPFFRLNLASSSPTTSRLACSMAPNERARRRRHHVHACGGDDAGLRLSRATLFTGQYPYAQRAQQRPDLRRWRYQARRPPTIATWLQQRGQRTALMGTERLRRPAPYVPPGWDNWRSWSRPRSTTTTRRPTGSCSLRLTPADYSTDVLATMAADFIRTSEIDCSSCGSRCMRCTRPRRLSLTRWRARCPGARLTERGRRLR
jgi:hypothetical protein